MAERGLRQHGVSFSLEENINLVWWEIVAFGLRWRALRDKHGVFLNEFVLKVEKDLQKFFRVKKIFKCRNEFAFLLNEEVPKHVKILLTSFGTSCLEMVLYLLIMNAAFSFRRRSNHCSGRVIVNRLTLLDILKCPSSSHSFIFSVRLR